MPKRKSEEMLGAPPTSAGAHGTAASPIQPPQVERTQTDQDAMLQLIGAKFDRFVETLRDLLDATPSANFTLRPQHAADAAGAETSTAAAAARGENEDKLVIAKVLKRMKDKGQLTWLDGYISNRQPDGVDGSSATVGDRAAAMADTSALGKLAQLATMAEVITALEESEAETSWPPPLPEIHDEGLLRQCLTHRSYAFEQAPHGTTKTEMAGKHNERLEFLGDAVLYYVCTKLLYAKFPDAREGELSILRSELIGNHTGCEMGTAYGLQKRLLLSEAADLEQSVRSNSKVIADTFEAYLGALLLDGPDGPSRCLRWLAKLMKPKIDAHIRTADVGEVDTLAKQRIHNHFGRHLPSNKTDPRHAHRGLPIMAITYAWVDGSGGNQGGFVTACKLGVEAIAHEPVELGRGWGPNKKEAEHRAAMDACKNFGLNAPSDFLGMPTPFADADPEGLALTAKVLQQLLNQL